MTDLSLFTTAATPKQSDTTADPRTSFREVQAQDSVVWSKTLYEAYLRRVTLDPTDQEAIDWFLSDSTGNLGFLTCCRIFGIDGDTVRDAIQQLQRRNHHE